MGHQRGPALWVGWPAPSCGVRGRCGRLPISLAGAILAARGRRPPRHDRCFARVWPAGVPGRVRGVSKPCGAKPNAQVSRVRPSERAVVASGRRSV